MNRLQITLGGTIALLTACSSPVAKPKPQAAVAPSSFDAGPPDLGVVDAGPTVTPTRAVERLLIVGDSMAATDFGRALERRLAKLDGLKVARKGKSATGLARPDFYDWFAQAEKQTKKNRPDLVVVVIGGNDGQDLLNEEGKGRIVFNSKRWPAAYQKRVTDFAATLTANNRRVAWLELPVMDRARLEKKLSTIRALQRVALEANPDVFWVETRPLFLTESGKIKRRVGRRKMRQKDGIHFSLAGSRYFADGVVELLKDVLHQGVPVTDPEEVSANEPVDQSE